MLSFQKLLLAALPLSLMACGDICGDGIQKLSVGEECDDGNTNDGDGCSSLCTLNTKVISEDVNGVNPNEATFAIFNSVISPGLDLDADGAADDALSSLFVVISTSPTACDDLLADPFLQNTTDATLVFATAIKTELDSAGVGFRSEEELLGTGEDFTAADNLNVSANFTLKEAGVIVASPASEGKGVFRFILSDTGDLLDGFSEDLMTRDFADPNTFDTDLDGDGLFDFLSVPPAGIRMAIVGATLCDGLFE